MTVRVTALHLAAAHQGSMTAVERVSAEQGRGLVGDRYHGTRHRHVSVQSLDELADAARRLDAPVPAERTRRNITLDSGPVPTTPGDRLMIGEVLLEVVRPAAPCRVMDLSVGPGARRALSGRGGAVFRVLSSGTIAVGDEARGAAADDPQPLAPSPGSVDAR